MDHSTQSSTVHGISPARILEWAANSFSKGSSQPRGRTKVSCIFCTGRQILYHCESESHSVVSDSLRPRELYTPWNSPGQNTGVDSLSLLQGIFPTQGSNPGLLHCRWILYQLSHLRREAPEPPGKDLCWEIINGIRYQVPNTCSLIKWRNAWFNFVNSWTWDTARHRLTHLGIQEEADLLGEGLDWLISACRTPIDRGLQWASHQVQFLCAENGSPPSFPSVLFSTFSGMWASRGFPRQACSWLTLVLVRHLSRAALSKLLAFRNSQRISLVTHLWAPTPHHISSNGGGQKERCLWVNSIRLNNNQSQ